MKILHVGKFYSPIEGGIESINKVVVNALKGNSQRIISFNNFNKSKYEDIDGIPVLREALWGVVRRQPLSYKYYGDLKRLVKYYAPDVIHFHYPNPLVAFYLLLLNLDKTKVIVHWHSDIVAQKNFLPFIYPIERCLLKRADVIIATSENYRDNSISLKHFVDKVKVIPCSIDENSFGLSSDDVKKIEKIKESYQNRSIVFFVGRHVDYKGIKYLLDAEKMIKAECVIVVGGVGPLTESLRKQYTSERIKWIGRVSNEEMKLYYHAAAILAFPSITKNEAFGVVLAEAMSCGTPAITFTIKGSGVNWVAPNNIAAIEVENSNSEAYAEAIDKLLTDENLRHELGVNAKKRTIELFSKNVVEEQYCKLYASLVNERP